MKQSAALLAVSTLLVACGATEKAPAVDSAAAAPAVSAITIASLAGDFSWVLKSVPGDSVMQSGTSHQNPDGTGWTVGADTPKDTTRYTAQLVGDSLISTSAPYKGTGAMKNAGELVWRAAGVPSLEGARTVNLTVSATAKPDSVLMRARGELTKK